MKKFDMRKIMKRAWKIRTEKMTMGEALKKAWAEAKTPAKKAFSGREEIDGFQFVLWEKYGKKRIYVNNFSGRNKKNSGGYIDLENMNITATGCVASMCRRFLAEYSV